MMESGKLVPQVTGQDQGASFLGSLTDGTTTLIIMQNLLVVFVAKFVTTVLFELGREGKIRFFV